MLLKPFKDYPYLRGSLLYFKDYSLLKEFLGSCRRTALGGRGCLLFVGRALPGARD